MKIDLENAAVSQTSFCRSAHDSEKHTATPFSTFLFSPVVTHMIYITPLWSMSTIGLLQQYTITIYITTMVQVLILNCNSFPFSSNSWKPDLHQCTKCKETFLIYSVTITCRLREIMQIRYMQISHMANNNVNSFPFSSNSWKPDLCMHQM